MPWYVILLLIGLVFAPFDALYVYIKSEKRRDALRRRRGQEEAERRPPDEEKGD